MFIVFLRHYPLVEGNSMRRFGDQLVSSFSRKGHSVINIYPDQVLSRVFRRSQILCRISSYIDQFVIFNLKIFFLSRFRYRKNTLYVLVDQALSPYLIALFRRRTVVHVHDLLALDASRGNQEYRKLNLNSVLYQHFIAFFFGWSKNFIAVSKSTAFLFEREVSTGTRVDFVYNPLQDNYSRENIDLSLHRSRDFVASLRQTKYLFHIGRNWYKNREGLLLLWIEYCKIYSPIELILVGNLSPSLESILSKNAHLMQHLTVLTHVSGNDLIALYSNAEALIFPSLGEGFGWPIIEAMACSCLVVTTDHVPMNEIAGDFSLYLATFPQSLSDQSEWSKSSARKVYAHLNQSNDHKLFLKQKGLDWSKQFNENDWSDNVEKIYLNSLD